MEEADIEEHRSDADMHFFDTHASIYANASICATCLHVQKSRADRKPDTLALLQPVIRNDVSH